MPKKQQGAKATKEDPSIPSSELKKEYELARDAIVEKVSAKQSQYNQRGVFNEHINAIRAENALRVALGKMNWATIQRRAKKRLMAQQQKDGGTVGHHTDVDTTNGGATSAGLGGTYLDGGGASPTATTSHVGRRGNKCQDIIRELNAKHDESRNDLRRQMEEHKEKEIKERVKQGMQQPNKTGGGAKEAPTTTSVKFSANTNNVISPNNVPLESQHQAPALSPAPASTAATPEPTSLEAESKQKTKPASKASSASKSLPRLDSNVRATVTTPPLPSLSPRPKKEAVVERQPECPWSTAEFLQGTFEHRDYPELVQKARLRERRRDEMHRGHNAIERYTLPRSHMLCYRGTTGHTNESVGGAGDEEEMESTANNRLASLAQWERHRVKVDMEQMLTSTSLLEMAHRPKDSRMTLLREHAERNRKVTAPKDPKETKDEDASVPGSGAVTPSKSKAQSSVTDQQSAGVPKKGTKKDKRGNKQGDDTVTTESVSVIEKERRIRQVVQRRRKEVQLGLEKERDAVSMLYQAPPIDDEDQEEPNYESSEEGDLENDDLRLDTMGDTDPTALDLLEAVTVCLCEEYSKKRSSSNTRGIRELAVLRNILLSALQTVQPRVQAAHEQQLNASRGLAEEGMQLRTLLLDEEALRVMRSWTKGAEILFTIDLELMVQPFNSRHAQHIDALGEYYCSLFAFTRKRTEELLHQWRSNFDNHKASPALLAKLALQRATNPDAAEKKPSTTTTDPNQLQRIAHIHTFIGDTMSKFSKDAIDSMSAADAEKAIHSKRILNQFMEKYGSLIELPSNANSKELARGRAARSHLREKLLRFVNVSQDEEVLNKLLERAEVSNRCVSTLLNVFQHTWIRESDSASGIANQSEAEKRAFAAACYTVTVIIDMYMRITSKVANEQFRKAVAYYKSRTMLKTAEDSNELIGLPDLSDKEKGEARSALDGALEMKEVETTILQEKYSRPTDTNKMSTMAQLRQALASTDVWSGNFPGSIAVDEANPALTSNTSNGAPPAPAGATTDEDNLSADKKEQLRMRRMQELDACWSQLKYPFQDKLMLFEKWNVKELNELTNAIPVWKAAHAAILSRESVLERVILLRQSETPDSTEAPGLLEQLSRLNSECDKQVRRVQSALGDAVSYQGVEYQSKMKQDYAAVMSGSFDVSLLAGAAESQ